MNSCDDATVLPKTLRYDRATTGIRNLVDGDSVFLLLVLVWRPLWPECVQSRSDWTHGRLQSSRVRGFAKHEDLVLIRITTKDCKYHRRPPAAACRLHTAAGCRLHTAGCRRRHLPAGLLRLLRPFLLLLLLLLWVARRKEHCLQKHSSSLSRSHGSVRGTAAHIFHESVF